jgi:thioredoxin 1
MSNGGLKIKKFYADWCGPCKAVTPALRQAAEELGIEVEEVNIETNRELAMDYNVRSIPTVVLLHNGKEIGRFVGLQQYGDIKKELEGFLNG